jgi:hypothetical protein
MNGDSLTLRSFTQTDKAAERHTRWVDSKHVGQMIASKPQKEKPQRRKQPNPRQDSAGVGHGKVRWIKPNQAYVYLAPLISGP